MELFHDCELVLDLIQSIKIYPTHQSGYNQIGNSASTLKHNMSTVFFLCFGQLLILLLK